MEEGRALIGDQILGMIAARSALEIAAQRTIGAVGTRAAAAGGGAQLIFANRIAGTDDHSRGYSAIATRSQVVS